MDLSISLTMGRVETRLTESTLRSFEMRLTPFSIHLLPKSKRDSDGQRMGEILIGDFTERFTVFPFLGTVEPVVGLWQDQLRSLVTGVSAVGLPTASNMTWILYRFGSKVKIHQMLMLHGMRELPSKFRHQGPRILRSGKVIKIPDYAAVDEDGERISEWTTTIAAVCKFLVA
jgi:hypothetical protein